MHPLIRSKKMTQTSKTPAIKQGWLRATLIILPFFIITGMFQFVGLAISSIISGDDLMQILQNPNNISTVSHLITQVFGTIGTLLLVWIFTRFIDREKILNIGFSLKKRGNDILYGLVAGTLMMGLGSVFLYFAGYLTYETITFNFIGLIQAIFLFIFVSINEEVFVRGYLLRNFMGSMNRYFALILSSLIFMALHLMNPNISTVGIINLFLAGILLGIGYIFTKNLWFPLALHFSWNFFQGPIFGFEVSGTNTSSLITNKIQGSELITGGQFGLEGSLIATTLCAISILIFWLIYKKQDVVKSESITI